MYPVKLELQENLQSSIKEIKESLRNIPNKGIGFGAIYSDKLIKLPGISFNYLGQFDTKDEQWQVVSEDSGIAMHADNIDTNIININGMVMEGELRFSIVTKLGKEETIEFANNFQQNLEEIILHCKNIIKNSNSQFTPSDFKTVNISRQLLDKIQKDKENQIEHIYQANSLQQGFIYHALSQPEDTDLADNLKSRYNSFGIDNFNILNEENISSLNFLANEYVNALPDFKSTDEINLCGWSLGGQLALEIGYVLEQKSFTNINIYLLDTVIQDEYLISLANKLDDVEFNQKMKEHMITEGYDEDYVNKVMRASKAEKEISKQPVSGVLTSSKVILFKALQEGKRIDYEGRKNIYKYTQSLKDNNVGQFVKNLEVINLECDHGNIVEYMIANDKYLNLL